MLGSKRRANQQTKELCAVDVGTTKVCTLIGSLQDDEYFRIIGVGIVPTHGMRKAQVVNLDEVGESVRESVRQAELTSGMKVTSAYIGVTGSHISSFNTNSVLAVAGGADRPVGDQDLKRLLEPVRAMRMSPDREVLHAIPQSYHLDSQEGLRQPVGMYGFRLGTEVHVVTAATNSVRNLIKAVRRAGVEPEDVVLEPLASGEAVLRPVEKDVGVLVVDIGGGTTDIAVFKNGSLWHTAAIAVGGYQVTRDISIGLGLSYEEAEQIKLNYASLDRFGNGSPEADSDDEGLPRQQLREIVGERIEELLRLVWVEVGAGQLSSLAPAGVVLTGGTSKLPGMAEMAQEVFQVPCRVGVPRNISGMVDCLHDPAYSTSVGLLYWGARGAQNELHRHHRPSPLSRIWLGVKRRLGWRRWLPF